MDLHYLSIVNNLVSVGLSSKKNYNILYTSESNKIMNRICFFKIAECIGRKKTLLQWIIVVMKMINFLSINFEDK